MNLVTRWAITDDDEPNPPTAREVGCRRDSRDEAFSLELSR
jgi:hypothetical protein